MKKIPTLFERTFDENHKLTGITDTVTEGMEWVLEGEGRATIKWDGAACAIIQGKLYKRYDAKDGKKPPKGAIPCQAEPDPVTGHWPHWLAVDANKSEDRWYAAAFWHTLDNGEALTDGTYEAVGRHFNGNPYGYALDRLIPHGAHKVMVERSFEGIRRFLTENDVEGLVFWREGEPMCKIKRRDFGLAWPIVNAVRGG